MKFSSLCFLNAVLLSHAIVYGDTFVDDLGFEHQSVENPKIIMSAQLAISMHHLGMPDDMLLAHFGLPFNRASYAVDPNIASQYETDAQAEDLEWLNAFPSLSPTCWDQEVGLQGCNSLEFSGIDTDVLGGLETAPDFVAESPRIFSADLAVNSTKMTGADLIFIDSAFDGAEDCRPDRTQPNAGFSKDQCYRRSSAQVLRRYEELAVFLGFEISEQAKLEKEEMCDASRRLSSVGEGAHQKGIRILGASINKPRATVYVTNPGQFHSYRSMEGLGLPIMWPGKCPEVRTIEECYPWGPLPGGFEFVSFDKFFGACDGGEITEECATAEGSALYPVDFWILEGTAYTGIIEGTLPVPDRALNAGQYYYIDANEGIVSYRSITAYFNELSDRLEAAESLHDNNGQCTNVDHSHGAFHNNHLDGGLEGGQFACYNPDYHDEYCDPAFHSVSGGEGEGGDDGGFELCFPGISLVKLEDKGFIPMRDLKIGDRVQVTNDGKFDTVYSFGHYQPDAVAEYLNIQFSTKAKPITISPMHMLFLDKGKAVPASFIKVGDRLLDGKVVAKVDKVTSKGAFAPFTYSGTIVVDDVVASNYVSLTGSSTFLGMDMQFVAHTTVTALRLLSLQTMASSENYNKDGVATWVPYRAASWLADHEVSVACLALIAGSALTFTRFRLNKCL